MTSSTLLPTTPRFTPAQWITPFALLALLLLSSHSTAEEQNADHAETQLVDWAHALAPTVKTPYRDTSIPWFRLRGVVNDYLHLPNKHLSKHPQADTFPGSVADDAPRTTLDTSIDLNTPRWQFTGAYAAAGEVITIHTPKALVDKKIKLVIGDHTDTVIRRREQRSGMTRFPTISKTITLNKETIEVGSPFGGMLYLDIPYELCTAKPVYQINCFGFTISPYATSPEPKLAQITLSNVIAAAKLTPDMSAQRIQEELGKPAPWVEIDFGTLSTSIPKKYAQHITDLPALATHWNAVMDAIWTQGGYTGVRHIDQRIAFDVQHSAGLMHSGYPIMVNLKDIGQLLSLERLQTRGSWGLYHELGHNHQPRITTPDGYVETTVNLYSLIGFHATMPDQEPTQFHNAIKDQRWLTKRLAQRFEGQAGAWENLGIYIACARHFGIDSIQSTYRSIFDSPNHGAFPGTRGQAGSSKQREDQWVLHYSEVVKHDLSAIYQKAGFHVSKETQQALAKYPTWNPTLDELKSLPAKW